MVGTSFYWKQIRFDRRSYPDQGILVLFFEDPIERPAEAIRHCFEFLGLNPDPVESNLFPANYTSARKRIDGIVLRGLRRRPFARKVKNLLSHLACANMPMFRRSSLKRPEWPVQLSLDLAARLKFDTKRFLSFFDRPDSWRLK